MKKQNQLYRGKAKTLYSTDNENYLIVEFRDDTSAFDGEKVKQLADKGKVNNQFNAFIMQQLEKAGIPTHFEKLLSAQESLVKHLKMIPVECVVRNITAGSISRRLGVAEGLDLNPPTFEFFLKNDALHDPMINEYHIASFGWARPEDIEEMKRLSFTVNGILKKLFLDAGMLLVDYKLEFGLYHNKIILGDEFTPDGCRIWDKDTREKLDKDRFRRDLGNVVESYQIAAKRLGVPLD